MNLYFIFTIDGDWDEYFDRRLTEEKRKPNEPEMLEWIGLEIDLAQKLLNGRFLHFIHTSPRAREYYAKPDFINIWRKIEENGGCVGVHCHEEDPYIDYYHTDIEAMQKAIGGQAKILRENGLNPQSYRGGFLAYNQKITQILEDNDIPLDFSCGPGRHLVFNNVLVADWRNSPTNYYRLDHNDHRKAGNSKVFEIPLGHANGQSLYIETISLWNVLKTAWALRKAAKRSQKPIIVSVLGHTYQFKSWRERVKIRAVLYICKWFGKFINTQETLNLIQKGNN